MKNTIFLVAMACLLAGCVGNNTNPDFKAAVQGDKACPPLKVDVKSDPNEPNLSVIIKTQGDNALPVKMKSSLAIWIASLAAFFTLLSAGGAWRAASNTKKTAEGRLFVELTREYVSDEMGKGIKELNDWWEKKGGAFKKMEEWQEWINVELTEKQREKEAEEILKRFGDKLPLISKVAIYFLTTLQLYKSGYVSRKFARSICDITRITDGVEYSMELFIWANGGGNKKVEKFRNELRKIRHIEGA